MSSMSNFLENALVDLILRGQTQTINGKTISWSAAPLYYVALYTTLPDEANAGGVEVSGGSYARVGFGTGTPSAATAASLSLMAGTQAAASTTASTGTGGQTSNNNAVTFPAPTANWGSIVGFGILDQPTGGNALFLTTLGTPKTVNNGDPAPAFNAGQLTITFA